MESSLLLRPPPPTAPTVASHASASAWAPSRDIDAGQLRYGLMGLPVRRSGALDR